MVRTEESEREKNLALLPRSRGPCSRGPEGEAGGCLMGKRPRVVVFFLIQRCLEFNVKSCMLL